MIKKLILLAAIFSTPLLRGEPCVDIIKSTGLRTQKYPLKNCRRIDVRAPCRTGSTLVYNVCRFLFEDVNALEKANGENSLDERVVYKRLYVPSASDDKACLILCTIRNPIDACFSHYRCESILHHVNEVSDSVINRVVLEYVSNMQNLEKLIEQKANVVVFKYEDFSPSIDSLLKMFEGSFSLEISSHDKALANEIFSKESIIRCTKQFTSFLNYDPRTHIHGNHIDMGEIPSAEKELIKKKIKEKLSPYKNSFNRFGYQL